MLTFKNRISLALAAAALLAGFNARAADPIEVPLKTVSLDIRQTSILSNMDSARPRTSSNDKIVPPTTAVITTTAPYDRITLDGVKVTIRYPGPPKLQISTEAGTLNLTKPGNATAGVLLPPVDIPLAKDHTYRLAMYWSYAIDQQAVLTFRSGQVKQATIDGTPVSLYDDNVDGRYTVFKDAILVGKLGPLNVFSPLGKRFAVGEKIYTIDKLADDGSSMTITPYESPTAKLTVAPGPAGMEWYASFLSPESPMAVPIVANAKGGSGIAIPGSYRLAYGYIWSPTSQRLIATIAPQSIPVVKVGDDSQPAVAWGGPYKIDFKVALTGRTFKIDPQNFHVLGKAGEEYTNLSYQTETAPEVAILNGTQRIVLGKMAFG